MSVDANAAIRASVALREAERAGAIAWGLLQRLGIERLDIEWLSNSTDDDVFRHVRAMPSFQARIVELARDFTDGEPAPTVLIIPPLPSHIDFPPLATWALAPAVTFNTPLQALALPPPPLPEKPAFEWTEEQRAALDAIEKWDPGRVAKNAADEFYSLTGPAGTGKSTLVREIAARYPHAALTAMTGKAALRLAECAGYPATTLHKILYWPPAPGQETKFTRMREPISEFVITDESSMMTPSVFKDLQKWTANGVKVLLVGDSYQLPPVITGDELKKHGEDYSVFAQVRGSVLETVMRSVGGVLRAASKVRQTGEICRESDMDGSQGYEFVKCEHPIERAVDDYVADRADHMLITWKNATRMYANRQVRERLGHGGPLPDEGEPVLLKKNVGGFLNGEIVTCGGFEKGPEVGSLRTLWMWVGDQRLLVSIDGGSREKGGEFFDGGMPWIENWRAYHVDLQKLGLNEPCPITWAYCLTAHSAQGSEARRVTVFLEYPDVRSGYFKKATTLPSGASASFAARWVYTAMTRSKMQTTMVVGR